MMEEEPSTVQAADAPRMFYRPILQDSGAVTSGVLSPIYRIRTLPEHRCRSVASPPVASAALFTVIHFCQVQ